MVDGEGKVGLKHTTIWLTSP